MRKNAGKHVGITLALLALAACSASQKPTQYEIRAVDDPEVIERGRRLVYGPMHCAACHGGDSVEGQGWEAPLSGGKRFELGMLGALVAPNITSDEHTGIGGITDDSLVRSLRYGISRDGQPLAPIMGFADLSDADLQAVISFLRTLPALPGPGLREELSWLGSIVLPVMLRPLAPETAPPVRVDPQPSSDYGRYLAHSVANCHGCHTPRSRLTGRFTGVDFSGGMTWEEPTGTFVAPNLTPVPDGIIDALDEAQFVERFRIENRGASGSPMPWEAYRALTDLELVAIYRYLQSLPPANLM